MDYALNLLKRFYPVILGAAGGYAYYYFIGCATGACPITSNPYISVLYGSLVGGILVSGKPKTKKEEA